MISSDDAWETWPTASGSPVELRVLVCVSSQDAAVGRDNIDGQDLFASPAPVLERKEQRQ